MCPSESRAERFQNLHVHLRTDIDTYQKEMLDKWKRDTESAVASGEPTQPVWMRRTDEMGSEFAAHIDYMVPGVGYFGAIDITDSVDVWLPKEDGSGEPIVVTSEPYELEALERAIALVESVVQPAEPQD